MISSFCAQYKCEADQIWRNLYVKFSKKFHINLALRAKRKGVKLIEIIEELGLLAEFYQLAVNTFEGEENLFERSLN
jgi:hypothetical protein